MKFKAQAVPFSSVVGSSVSLIAEDGSVGAILSILVPNPRHDYKTVAADVTKQILTAFNSDD